MTVYFGANDIILGNQHFPQYVGNTIKEAVRLSYKYTDSILIMNSGNGCFRKNLLKEIKEKYTTRKHIMDKRQKWFVDRYCLGV